MFVCISEFFFFFFSILYLVILSPLRIDLQQKFFHLQVYPHISMRGVFHNDPPSYELKKENNKFWGSFRQIWGQTHPPPPSPKDHIQGVHGKACTCNYCSTFHDVLSVVWHFNTILFKLLI